MFEGLEEKVRYEDKEVATIGSLIDKLDAQRAKGELLWFRGQSDIDWSIAPSIARKGKDPIAREWALYKRFRQNAGRLASDKPATDWDWYLLMQHFGLPTRLLDWTESPLTALYFAVEDSKSSKKDGVLWVISPTALNGSLGFPSSVKNDLPCIGLDLELEGYRIDEVRKTKTFLSPVAAIAPRNSARMVAQHGVFVVYHGDFVPLDKLADTSFAWRYKIPSSSKSKLLEELAALSISRLSLFPELPNVADFAKEILG